MKRIICFIFVFVLCSCLFCSAVSASNNYEGGNAVYTIAYNRSVGSEEFGSVDLTVNQYVGEQPISVVGTEGWLYQYFGSTLPLSGFYNVSLFNGTRFSFVFSANSYSCYYSYNGYDDTINVSIVSNISKNRDFFLYVDRNGNFEICIYEIADNFIVSTGSFVPNLSGVIFPYNQVPGGTGTDSSYEQGYNNGYDAGVNATYSEAYNLGFQRGQDSEKIVGNALQGFFQGMQGFFFPFLSIGVGNFTLSNLLGIIVNVFIVIVIVKIVRG